MAKKQTLGECVKAFLGLALVHPEKEPKTQRAQRDNQMMILGYNRAQEHFRAILREHGRAEIPKLADIRTENQQQPVDIGGTRVWLA